MTDCRQNIKKYSVLHSLEEIEVKTCLSNSAYLDKIISVSDNGERMILSANHENSVRATVIPVGINIKKEEPNVWGKELQIIYVGRICKAQKNISAIIKILVGLRDRNINFKMHFIGSGDYFINLKKQIKDNDLTKRCVLYGAKSPSEVHEHILKANVIIMTSYSEGTPHSLLEAMSVGVIPISSLIPGSTDKIITNRVNGFLCEVDKIDDYIDTIILLQKDKVFREEIQKNAIQSIKDNFSINTITEKYIDVFNQNEIKLDKSNRFIFDEFANLVCPSFFRNLKTYIGNYKRIIFNGIKPIKYKN